MGKYDTDEVRNRATQLGRNYAAYEAYTGREEQDAPLSGEWADGLDYRDVFTSITGTEYSSIEGVEEIEEADFLLDLWEAGYLDLWEAEIKKEQENEK